MNHVKIVKTDIENYDIFEKIIDILSKLTRIGANQIVQTKKAIHESSWMARYRFSPETISQTSIMKGSFRGNVG